MPILWFGDERPLYEIQRARRSSRLSFSDAFSRSRSSVDSPGR